MSLTPSRNDQPRLDTLRQALPEVISSHIEALESGAFKEEKMSEVLHLIKVFLQTGLCDQVYRNDLNAIMPFMILLFKQLSEPTLRSFSGFVIENLILLFRFVRRRSILGFRRVFYDLLGCISEISQYVQSGAHCSAEQAGLPVQICILSSFCQFISCQSLNCESLSDSIASTSLHFASQCLFHPVSTTLAVKIDTFKRIELFHASCTMIVGQMMTENMYLHDLMFILVSLLSKQIVGFSSEVQEASVYSLVQFAKYSPSQSLFPAVLQILELVSTDCFRTATFESEVAALLGISASPSFLVMFRPIASDILISLQRAFELAHTSSLRVSIVKFVSELFSEYPYLRLYMDLFKHNLLNPDLLRALYPLLNRVVQSLPDCFSSTSLAVNPIPEKFQGCSNSNVFVLNALWSFFHEFIDRTLQSSPTKFASPCSDAVSAFTCVSVAFSCFVRKQNMGLFSQLVSLVGDWFQLIKLASLENPGPDPEIQVPVLLSICFQMMAASFGLMQADLFQNLHRVCIALISVPFESENDNLNTNQMQMYALQAWSRLPSSPDKILEMDLVMKRLPVILSHLPLIMFRISPEESVRNSLIVTVLDALKSNDSLQSDTRKMVGCVGYLYCTLSNLCSINYGSDFNGVDVLDSSIECKFCDSCCNNQTTANDPKYPSWNHCSYFLRFLYSEHPVDVRAEACRQFFRFLCHAKRNDLIQSRHLGSMLIDLLFDEQSEVRSACSQSLHLLLSGEPETCALVALYGPSENDSRFRSNPVLHSVRTLVERISEANERHDNMETFKDVISSLASVAKYVFGTAQSIIIFVLIQQMMQEDVSLRALAYQKICDIAIHCGITTADLIQQPYVEEFILLWMPERPLVCDEVCEAFLGISVCEFLHRCLPRALPGLILKHAEEALHEIGLRLGVSVRSFVMDRISPILLRILLDNDPEESKAASAIAFLSEKVIPGFRFSELLKQSKSLLLENLIDAMGISSQCENAQYALRILVLADSGCGFGDYVTEKVDLVVSTNQMSSFCSEYFLMMSDYLCQFIQGASYTDERKLQSLRSLDCLCKLVANRIYNFSSKLIATVKLALERSVSSLVKLEALNILDGFIKMLSSDQLCNCLSQLVVTLLSCWHSNVDAILRKRIASLLEMLLVEKRESLSGSFSDIPIIPDDPALNHIKASVETLSTECNIAKKIGNFIRLMNYPSANVREMALSQLHVLLLHYENDMHTLISQNDSLLRHLVVALMHRCSDASFEARLLCAECIGVLGAIDPAQIGYINVRRDPVALCTADDFALTLCVEYLINAIRSLPPADQNRSMFALQEILKFVQCRPETPELARDTSFHMELSKADRRAVEFWSKIPVELRDVAIPCLISNFAIASRKPSPFDGNVFWRHEISFERWIAEWTRFLIANCQGPMKPIFEACQGVVVSDLATARFLLPHLVVSALLSENQTTVDQIRMEILAILEDATTKGPIPIRTEQRSIQTIFDLLDLLRLGCDSRRTHKLPIPVKMIRCFQYTSYPCAAVQDLLSSIPHMTLARAAHACGANARALRHFEQHIRQTGSILTSQHLEFLQSLFFDLDDTDGMRSIPALRTEPAKPSEQGHDYESLGQWNMALICYQEECRSQLDNINSRVRLLHSMFKLGQYENCIAHVRKFLQGQGAVQSAQDQIVSLGIEAAWRILDWETLGVLIEQHPDQCSFGVGLGRAFICYKDSEDPSQIESILRSTRIGVMSKLAAAAQESYSRAYPLWVQLQLLHTFSTALEVGSRSPWDWFRYVLNMQPKFAVREAQLSLLRTIFELSAWKEMAGRCWLQIAREARRSGELEQASYAAFRAHRLQIRNSGIERAKILRAQGLLHQALNVLEEYTNVDTSLVADSLSADRQIELCNMACLVGQYMQESESRTANLVSSCYRKAISQFPNSNRAHFLLASYSDMLLRSSLNEPDLTDNKRHALIRDQAPQIIRHYIAAVREKSNCVFESMPRIITLFCELAPVARTNVKTTDDPDRIAKDAVDVIPAQHWFLTLPQIISRLQSDNCVVQKFLQAIISKTILTFPRQTTWLVAPIANFKNEKRKQIVVAVLNSMNRSMPSKSAQELDNARKLLRLLIDLCTSKAIDSKGIRFPSSLRRFLRASSPCLILPLQSTLTVAIPEPADQDGDISSSGPGFDMKPFYGDPAMLQSIDENVQVLLSKEKPLKAAFVDTNGNRHWFLCKREGEGDMRKNSRMMDFASVMNRLFRCSTDARQRQLSLRTFAVLPLREDCGIIEWIPDTIALRSLIDHFQYDQPFKFRDQYNWYKESMQSPAERYRQMLDKVPPVMHRFFLDKFPDPNSWYESRLIFTRSWASWCIIGHILGLGDRHSDNILIDHNTGEAIHVDFDCLFDRGLNLKTPEVVPFRLTQNALDGMGITKYEGAFRSCCHIVLTVLRTHHETVKNCLETFVHDPLVEWIGPSSSVAARKAMTDIEKRLAGRIGDSILKVTIEGYVEHLIQQAISADNLGRMFVGWAPWM